MYRILSDNMERFEKKIKTIKNKCEKYGVKFNYEVIDTEYTTFVNDNGKEQTLKYFLVEVEGSVQHNGWRFIATIEHKDSMNVVRQLDTSVEIPNRYYHTSNVCEHCNSKRNRKDTYLIYNEETQEFKQVGKSCLNEFTNGLSAEWVAYYISMFDELIKGEQPMGSSAKSWHNVKDILMVAAEVTKHFGYSSNSQSLGYNYGYNPNSTLNLTFDICYMHLNNAERINELEKKLQEVDFDANSNSELVEEMINWITSTEEQVGYINNMKAVVSEDYCEYRDLGLLVSLPNAYKKHLDSEARKVAYEIKKAEIDAKKSMSNYIGNIGDKLSIDVVKAECVTSYETQWGFTFVYRFETTNNETLIWKTSNCFDTDNIKSIRGTIKDHSEYRGEKQTILTRVKVA